MNLSFEKSANSPGISRLELFLDGRKGQDVRPGQSIRLETNSFSDGYHELRVVAVDDTPIETRTSKKIGFEVRNGDRQVQLEIVGSPKIEPGQSLKLKVSASFGDEITIMQNSRPIKTVEGDKGSIEIAGETLGAGKTKLRAVAIDAGETVASWPIDVEIQRDLK